MARQRHQIRVTFGGVAFGVARDKHWLYVLSNFALLALHHWKGVTIQWWAPLVAISYCPLGSPSPYFQRLEVI